MHKLNFFSSLLSIVLLSACAQDRDADDYKKAKLTEDLAKVEQVAGNYAGTLRQSSTDEAIGVVGLRIETGTRVDNLSEQVPVLKGILYFKSATTLKIVFQNSYFDPDTQSFKSSLSTPSNPEIVIELEGKVEGNRLTATLESFGYPELGGKMTLEKSFSPQSFDDLFKPDTSRGGPPVEIIDRVFEGTVNSRPLHMTINNKSLKPEDRFLDIFSPLRLVDVAMLISDQNDISFNRVQWDARNESFTASANRNSSEGNYITTLECHTSSESRSAALKVLNCEYSSSLLNKKVSFTVNETGSN